MWGQCKGSGKKPYQTVVDIKGPAFKCSCPSRKFPCKHALGLLLLWAGDDREVTAGEPAQWAGEWLAGRRERAERSASAPSDAGAPSRAPADPEAARRRAERRMQRIGAGATELEQRLEDLLRSGLASAERAGYGSWDETAARMVDAQAPGLASRVRELGSAAASGPHWPAQLLEECALLHLLDQGFLGIERLPAPLAATVRSRVGLTTEAADLLTGPEAATVRDRWLVLAQQDSEDGKLTTRRIFLRGERTGRMALHLSFGGANRPLDVALAPGLVLDADLAYYPGARPLRAVLGERHAPAAPGPVPPAAASMPPWPRTAMRCATTPGWIPGRWCSPMSHRYRAATGRAGSWPIRTGSRHSRWTRAAWAVRACGSWPPYRAGRRSRSSASAATAAFCR